MTPVQAARAAPGGSPGQRFEALLKLGACGAAPDVRAQLRLPELRQFPVDAERGPGSGAFALRG